MAIRTRTAAASALPAATGRAATRALLCVLLASSSTRTRADVSANPHPFERETISSASATKGAKTKVTECLAGNPKAIRRTDCDRHTIMTDPVTKTEVYALEDEETGDLVSSGCGLDDPDCNPYKEGIPLDATKSPELVAAECGTACHHNPDPPLNKIIKRAKDERRKEKMAKAKSEASQDDDEGEETGSRRRRNERRAQIDSGNHLRNTMKNLVLLIRFQNHSGGRRCQPSKQNIEILFNAQDGHDPIAPTGSVRDCFRYNSYGRFDLVSEVCDWCDVQHPEAYYGDGYYGMTGRLTEAIHHCLTQCEQQMGGFSRFDVDRDGNMDAIAILHSGYGSEWGGDDDQGAKFENRIWSHKWEMQTAWTGFSGVKVWSYHISPALWGTGGCNIGRIGVICHETGHFFGLPDLYDGDGGNGVGTTCLMGNSWGYSGDQYYPPMMSAWAKLRLGWADPVVITSNGQYTLQAAATHPTVYAFVNPANDKEYFLMENKQHHNYFERNLPQEGINIYHIDDSAAFDSEAYPGEIDWPQEHYRMAVVQPDGMWHLEKGENLGDAGDVFHGGFRDFIGPNGVGLGTAVKSPTVTTDWYSSGRFVSSGITIKEISNSGQTMTFRVEMTQGGADRDYDWGGDGRDSATCGVEGDTCSSHPDCCFPPKRRCRMVRKRGRKECVLKKKKRAKKVLGVVTRRWRNRYLRSRVEGEEEEE